jgi:hypothetical protein
MNMTASIASAGRAYTPEQSRAVIAGSTLPAGAHLRVRAGAGTGKTTTLVGVARARENQRGLYLAFNADIAREARLKFDQTNCRAVTFHALCLAAASPEMSGEAARRYQVKGDVLQHPAFARIGFPRLMGWSTYKLALAMLRTVSIFCASDEPSVTTLHAREALIAETGDPETLKGEFPRERALRAISAFARPLAVAAREFFEAKIAEGHFSHEVYLKLVALRPDLCARAFGGAEYLIVDEAQDLNPVQIQLLRQSGRSIVAVGDAAQAIYAWRGAISALEKLPGDTAHLSNSFRFGPDIAALANKVLRASPEGDLGVQVTGVGGSVPQNYAGARYAVLCRTNAAILDEATGLGTAGHSYHIDRSDQLRAEIQSALAIFRGDLREVTVPEFRAFSTWAELAEEASGNRNVEQIVKIIEEDRAGEALAVLNASQPAEQARVTLMTGHRSKGLEFPVVKMAADWVGLRDLAERVKEARDSSPKHLIAATQEYNLLYVAFTRAMQRLVGAERLLN